MTASRHHLLTTLEYAIKCQQFSEAAGPDPACGGGGGGGGGGVEDLTLEK